MPKLKRIYLALFATALLIALNLIPLPSTAQSKNNCTQTIIDADQKYLEGDRQAAEKLYRQCKKPFSEELADTYFPDPITDPAKLSPASAVYWKNIQKEQKRGNTSRILASVENLTKKDPAFVPAYNLLSEVEFKEQNKNNQAKILQVLEQGVTLFPNDADLAMARVGALRSNKQWINSSIAARQFAIVNPDHSEAKEFQKIADKDFKRFKGKIKTQYIATGTLGTVGNIFLGGGNTASKVTPTIQYGRMLIDGESGTGKRLAEGYKQQLRLVNDPQVNDYIDRIGQDMAKLMGRNDFEYEFYVVNDNAFNAFALPGGKVFVNTGAIMAANSEAELAGLIGHEVAHAVLSHGYQGMSRSSFFGSLNSFVDKSTGLSFSGIAANLALNAYSRNQEKQADILGARALNSYGYAADGASNLFKTLNSLTKNSPPEYLSSHPSSSRRVEYLEALVQQNGYNRFAYEGMKEHNEVRDRLKSVLGKR